MEIPWSISAYRRTIFQTKTCKDTAAFHIVRDCEVPSVSSPSRRRRFPELCLNGLIGWFYDDDDDDDDELMMTNFGAQLLIDTILLGLTIDFVDGLGQVNLCREQFRILSH